jgi:hypothetical protein
MDLCKTETITMMVMTTIMSTIPINMLPTLIPRSLQTHRIFNRVLFAVIVPHKLFKVPSFATDAARRSS